MAVNLTVIKKAISGRFGDRLSRKEIGELCGVTGRRVREKLAATLQAAVRHKILAPVSDDGKYLVIDAGAQQAPGLVRRSCLDHPTRNILELVAHAAWDANDTAFSVFVTRNRLVGPMVVPAQSSVVFSTSEDGESTQKRVSFYASLLSPDFVLDVSRTVNYLHTLGFSRFDAGSEAIRPRWVLGGGFSWEVRVPNPDNLPVDKALFDEESGAVAVRMYFMPYEALLSMEHGILGFFKNSIPSDKPAKFGRYAFTDEGVWCGVTDVKEQPVAPEPETTEDTEEISQQQ